MPNDFCSIVCLVAYQRERERERKKGGALVLDVFVSSCSPCPFLSLDLKTFILSFSLSLLYFFPVPNQEHQQ